MVISHQSLEFQEFLYKIYTSWRESGLYSNFFNEKDYMTNQDYITHMYLYNNASKDSDTHIHIFYNDNRGVYEYQVKCYNDHFGHESFDVENILNDSNRYVEMFKELLFSCEEKFNEYNEVNEYMIASNIGKRSTGKPRTRKQRGRKSRRKPRKTKRRKIKKLKTKRRKTRKVKKTKKNRKTKMSRKKLI